ncbi:hypothetical protein Acr_10g0006950 [Actinidia rufa]|uniref:Uncharacterized protein n=1 Tax=Actinidia rufa TaxID=165716 RepID=A0A7J0F9D4_9ERIC|nr:hypothetical protein Acr_10g0006950 [Actinidia rufa]
MGPSCLSKSSIFRTDRGFPKPRQFQPRRFMALDRGVEQPPQLEDYPKPHTFESPTLPSFYMQISSIAKPSSISSTSTSA